MFFFSLYCCQMAPLVHHLPFTAHLAFLDWGSASAVLAGLAHTLQRANSSERGALLHWREGSTVPPVLAVIPELWPARSAGNEEALNLLHSDMFRPEQEESSRAFHRGCQPTSVLWENPCVWAAECSDSCQKCVSCDQGISFILNKCIVMSKTLSQNFPRIGTQGFQIVPFEVHARCLSPCPQLPACRVTRWAPTLPRTSVQKLAHFKWLHQTQGVSSGMISLASARESGLVQSYFCCLGMNCTVLFPMYREVLWNYVVWGNNRHGRFVYVWLPFQPYPCLLFFTAMIPNLSCNYLTNMIFHSDIFLFN